MKAAFHYILPTVFVRWEIFVITIIWSSYFCFVVAMDYLFCWSVFSAVECHYKKVFYKMVHYNMALHIPQHWEVQNIDLLTDSILTHLSLVPHMSAPSHYLIQWWNIINRTLRNNLQWNSNPIKTSLKKIFLNCCPFCLGLNVLRSHSGDDTIILSHH